jgi:hypothetical protein
MIDLSSFNQRALLVCRPIMIHYTAGDTTFLRRRFCRGLFHTALFIDGGFPPMVRSNYYMCHIVN